MSQEKVDRYKKEKANRKETMKKERRMHRIRCTVAGVIAVVLVGWLCYSAYGLYEQKQPRNVAEVDYSAVNEYLENMVKDAE